MKRLLLLVTVAGLAFVGTASADERNLLMPPAASTVVATTIATPGTAALGAAHAADDGFIFSGNSVASVLDVRQSLRLGERLSLAQIKRRLPSYTVKLDECEGVCIHVSGKNGVYLELDYNHRGEPISQISGFLGSRDALGHIIGMSLIKAIGSSRAICDLGMDTTCASKSINGLSYFVNDDRCAQEDKITGGNNDPAYQYRLAECMTVEGIVIYRVRAR